MSSGALASLESQFDFESGRETMLRDHLQARGIGDPKLLAAFRAVPRHRFMDPHHWEEAYGDHPVSIDCGQTISQPYIVALMTQLLRLAPGRAVLEIGTGSGYQTAILAAMGARVFTVERHEALTERAAAILEDLGLDGDVEFHVGDGSLGLPERAPFDRILVTAAAPKVPSQLCAQLNPDGGLLVIPSGERGHQKLITVERKGDRFSEAAGLDVIFVPLVGEAGFAEK